MMKVLPLVHKMGQDLKREEKLKFKYLKSASVNLRIRAKDVASNVYKIDEANSACDDSDWLQEVIELIVDKLGDDKKKQRAFLNGLRRRESLLGLFND